MLALTTPVNYENNPHHFEGWVRIKRTTAPDPEDDEKKSGDAYANSPEAASSSSLGGGKLSSVMKFVGGKKSGPSWKRRYLTLDGTSLHVYPGPMREAEIDGEIVSAQVGGSADNNGSNGTATSGTGATDGGGPGGGSFKIGVIGRVDASSTANGGGKGKDRKGSIGEGSRKSGGSSQTRGSARGKLAAGTAEEPAFFLVEPEGLDAGATTSLLLSISTALANAAAKSAPPGKSSRRRRSGDSETSDPALASGRSIKDARTLIEQVQSRWHFIEPDRGNLDDPSIRWKNGKPDYTVTNLAYFLGKTKNHPKGSLELTVENLIKTWEMEATHKPFEQWTTVNHGRYVVAANGDEEIDGAEAAKMGNYNWLLRTCPKHLYDADKMSFRRSHAMFLRSFPNGFPFEVLEVYSGPPKVSFTWRHWASFEGEFRGNMGRGQTVELTGFGVAIVDDNLKICKIEIFYNPATFLEVLMGKRAPEEMRATGAAHGESIALGGSCPFGHSGGGGGGGIGGERSRDARGSRFSDSDVAR